METWQLYNTNGNRFTHILQEFSHVKTLVIGDVSKSSATYGVRSELEPIVVETNSKKSQLMFGWPGSAGLIATTIASMETDVRLLGVVGEDTAANELKKC